MNKVPRIETLKDSATIVLQDGSYSSTSGHHLIDIIETPQELVESIVETLLNDGYVVPPAGVEFKSLPMLIDGIYSPKNNADKDILKDVILKDVAKSKSRFAEMIAFCLDEEPENAHLHDLKNLSVQERYFRGEQLEETVKSNFSLVPAMGGNYEVQRNYFPESIFEACYVFFMDMIINESTIKRCGNCNRYFEKRKGYKSEYCNRRIGSLNKTCKDVGAIKRFNEKGKDEFAKLYDKRYKRVYARCYKYHKFGSRGAKVFTEWSDKAIEIKKAVKDNGLSINEFEQLLNEIEPKLT